MSKIKKTDLPALRVDIEAAQIEAAQIDAVEPHAATNPKN